MSAGSEVYYSKAAFNRLTVRRGGEKRDLNPRHGPISVDSESDFDKGDTKLRAELSFALLADALEDDARALRLHHAFRRRVASLLPDRWTMSRSRIRAYADMIEQYQAAGIKIDGDDARNSRAGDKLNG
jgi:hypothetical protein